MLHVWAHFLKLQPINTLRLRKMDAIFQMTFSNVFLWMKMYDFRLRFHWCLFLRFQFTIIQHWFRELLDAVQATSHHINQWWLVYWCIYIARPPHQPPVILSGTPEVGLAPLTCGCWPINSISASIGRRNSIRILNQFPFWWNILIRS